jgi:hypothetical protein
MYLGGGDSLLYGYVLLQNDFGPNAFVLEKIIGLFIISASSGFSIKSKSI